MLTLDESKHLLSGPFDFAHEAQSKSGIDSWSLRPCGETSLFPAWSKILINEDTVLVFGTTTNHRKYDLTLVREVVGDQIARRLALSDRLYLANKIAGLGCGGVLNDITVSSHIVCMPNSCPIDFTKV